MPTDIDDPSVEAIDNAQASLYLDGPQIANRYKVMSGQCFIPVAEEPPEDPSELRTWSPVIILKLHAPYRIRTSQFATKKQKSPPVLPSPTSVGAFTFLEGDLSFTNVASSQIGFDWSCDLTYVYVENCVSRTIDGFVLGTPGFNYPAQLINQNSVGGIPEVTPYGAIYQAGVDAKIGWLMSQNPTPLTIYNEPSYYPGTLFNDNLMNSALVSRAVPLGSPSDVG